MCVLIALLFLLFLIAKVVTIFEYPNKFLLFIENLCFCNLKIAVRAPKIPICGKKIKIPIRLKISVGSKNFGASVGKPSGVVQVFRTSERIAGSTGRKAGEPQRESRRGCRNTRLPKESRRATNKQIFCYIYRY